MRSMRWLQGQPRCTIRAGGLTPESLVGLNRWGHDVRSEPASGATNRILIKLSVTDDAALPAITRYLVAQNVEVYGITAQRQSLEEAFIQIVGTDGGL